MATGKQSEVSYTQRLADFAVETNFEHLPGEVVHQTKRIILDTIGCGIAGYSLDRGKIVAELVMDLGGKPEASVFVSGDKVACANAAFANADLANAIDGDETFLNFAHFANTIVANALALGERVGATGKDLITAVALGFDVTARIGLSIPALKVIGKPPNERIQWGPVFGYGFVTPGGAVAAGKILGLDKGKMADAIGLAGANAVCPSINKFLTEPALPMHKYAGYGFIAYTGVIAALLAEKGYTGDRTILDGDLGFWRFSGGLEVNWDLLVGELGKKWWILEDAIKLYPSCRLTHGCLDLFYKIKEEQKLKPEEIESVTTKLHSVAMGDKPIAEPSLTPQPNDLTLQFNMPYLISLAALGINPGPGWYSPERLTDPRLRELMKKVKVVEIESESISDLIKVIRDEPTKRFRKAPCSITVAARGTRFDARTDYIRGDPWQAETRISDAQLKEKFRSFCYTIIRSAKIEKAIESIYELEKVDNAAELAKFLTA